MFVNGFLLKKMFCFNFSGHFVSWISTSKVIFLLNLPIWAKFERFRVNIQVGVKHDFTYNDTYIEFNSNQLRK